MGVEKTLREFIEETFVERKGKKDVANDDSLLDSGLIDSAGIFENVGFLERTFGLDIQDTEIIPENFETINSLSAFVRGKQGSR